MPKPIKPYVAMKKNVMKKSTTLDDLLFLFEQIPAAPPISIEKWKEAGPFRASQDEIKINFKNWYGARKVGDKNAKYEG